MRGRQSRSYKRGIERLFLGYGLVHAHKGVKAHYSENHDRNSNTHISHEHLLHVSSNVLFERKQSRIENIGMVFFSHELFVYVYSNIFFARKQSCNADIGRLFLLDEPLVHVFSNIVFERKDISD